MSKKQISPARRIWKVFYRRLRIIRRESLKATVDMMIFGNGAVEIGPDIPDGIRHVPIESMRLYQ